MYLASILSIISDPKFAPVAGAGLGACFYILMKLQPYLENRSFDPKYNSAYITRFVIGIVAGVILAYVWAHLFNKQSSENKSFALQSFSPGVIGILGGFSAEAVQQVLQRIVEVLLTVVRGDNSAATQAKLTAQQAQAFGDLRDKLDVIEKAKDDPDALQKALNAAKAALKK
jgi:Na+-transporting NADH:ubiquinone oxidoreductase subunit NqrC